MALTEREEADKIEVVGPFRAVQVRTATVIERDGVEISRSFHRQVFQPTDSHEGQDPKVVAICEAVHTPEVIAAYEAHLASQQLPEAPVEEPAQP